MTQVDFGPSNIQPLPTGSSSSTLSPCYEYPQDTSNTQSLHYLESGYLPPLRDVGLQPRIGPRPIDQPESLGLSPPEVVIASDPSILMNPITVAARSDTGAGEPHYRLRPPQDPQINGGESPQEYEEFDRNSNPTSLRREVR